MLFLTFAVSYKKNESFRIQKSNKMTNPSDIELKEILGELTENDPEFMEELIDAYIENLEEFRTETGVAVRNMDMEQLKSSLHKVNPTLLTLQYERQYEMLSAIKTKLNEESIKENLGLIEVITKQVIGQLQHIKRDI